MPDEDGLLMVSQEMVLPSVFFIIMISDNSVDNTRINKLIVSANEREMQK